MGLLALSSVGAARVNICDVPLTKGSCVQMCPVPDLRQFLCKEGKHPTAFLHTPQLSKPTLPENECAMGQTNSETISRAAEMSECYRITPNPPIQAQRYQL